MSTTTEVNYTDAVEQDGGAHNADSLADNGDEKGETPFRHMGPARTEFAKSGYAGRSDETTPIGAQSGFAPLGDEDDAHGSGTYTSDDELRKSWGRLY